MTGGGLRQQLTFSMDDCSLLKCPRGWMSPAAQWVAELGGAGFCCLKFWIWGKFCSRKIRDIFFYVTDIPYSMCTIRGTNLIPWCYWAHLWEDLFKYFRVRAAGLKLFIVSFDSLQCCFCIGCSLSLNNNGAKMSVHKGHFCTSYSFWLVRYTAKKNWKDPFSASISYLE